MMKKYYLTDFGKGFLAGFIFAVIIFSVIIAFQIINKRNKERNEYAEKQIEVRELRENIISRSPDDFLEIPDVRRAADGAAAEFERKRDEILQRIRSRNSD
jgi:flagellar biosynthesis/type III secretory pathway M-ring protein FliF/YscJ